MKKTGMLLLTMFLAAAAIFAQVSFSDNLVRINGGTFTMGSPVNEPNRQGREGPQHQVTISSFFMGKYPVTQQEYEEIMDMNPSSFINPNMPVESISWYDAVEFCNKLSIREGLTPAYTIIGSGDMRTVLWIRDADGYRLPTEAEWEYACRAGTTTPFSTGYSISTDQANFNGHYPYYDNPAGEFRVTTTVVDSFAPNPWGLFDMHGNVWEWCWDWFDEYPRESQTNPSGPESGNYRVIRGGSWDYHGEFLRSAYRDFALASFPYNFIGFRLVRSAQN